MFSLLNPVITYFCAFLGGMEGEKTLTSPEDIFQLPDTVLNYNLLDKYLWSSYYVSDTGINILSITLGSYSRMFPRTCHCFLPMVNTQ